jgi:hypothetical protein
MSVAGIILTIFLIMVYIICAKITFTLIDKHLDAPIPVTFLCALCWPAGLVIVFIFIFLASLA